MGSGNHGSRRCPYQHHHQHRQPHNSAQSRTACAGRLLRPHRPAVQAMNACRSITIAGGHRPRLHRSFATRSRRRRPQGASTKATAAKPPPIAARTGSVATSTAWAANAAGTIPLRRLAPCCRLRLVLVALVPVSARWPVRSPAWCGVVLA